MGLCGLGVDVSGASAQTGTGGGAAPAGRNSAGLLAAVPYMGWNTYYGVGGIFDEGTILSVARTLIKRGLARAGYRIVWLDFGWASGARGADGQILVDPPPVAPRPALADRLAAPSPPAGRDLHRRGAQRLPKQGVGSLGHYQQDADAFAAWGFDAVKVDFCGAGQQGLDPRPLYTRFAHALAHNSSHRRLLLNVCNFWVPGQIDGTEPSYVNSAYANYRWAPRIAQSWRTDTDIGFTRDIQWVNVLRNLDRDAAHPTAAGPGHWNDPDYLGPELGMTAAEGQAQLSMWAIVAAPLMLGSDPRALSPSAIAMLENPEVIAVDQDRLGIQGTMIEQEGAGQVWSKPLAGGAVAVALLNRGPSPLRIATTASHAGLAAARSYRVRNVWAHRTASSTGAIDAVVAPDSAVLYRVLPD